MNGFKRWFLGVILGVFLPVLAVSGQFIETNQLTTAPTRAVEPLQVLMPEDEDTANFSGEILSRRPLEADRLQFTLLDEFDGVVWREYLELPKQAQRIMPFSFENIEASGDLFLSVQAYDQFGNTEGSGHKYLSLPEQIASVTINSSDVILQENNELSVDIFVVNGPVKQAYIPQIQIYQGLENYGELLDTEEVPFIDLQPRQQQVFNYSVSFPYPPGVYEIVVTLLDASNREPVSSAHYRHIYRAGPYFKIVELESYYVTADKSQARLKLDGLSTVVLTEPVQMRVRLQDQQNIYLDKNYSFTLQPGYFTKFIELELPSYVEKLEGTATFFLKGKKVQTVAFSSEEADAALLLANTNEDAQTVEEPIPPMVPTPKRWYLTNSEIIIIVIGCTIMLLLLVIINWIKSRWFAVGLLLLIGFGASSTTIHALTVGRDVFPMVEWSNPVINETRVFNPGSQEGFQWLPVKGRLFNYLTQTALLKGDEFDSVRLNFLSPDENLYQYQLSPELLKKNTEIELDSRSGDYFFVLDLGLLPETQPIGDQAPLVWEDGLWQLQIIFPYQQKSEDPIYLSTPTEDFGFFAIDQQPPLWQWQLKETTGETLGEADFTNKPITVSITCQDQGSACVTPIQDFSVVGNFCNDALKCNTQAAREFEVCDTIGNCRTEAISITGYDPVPPSIESLLIQNSEEMVATETPSLSIAYADPSRVESDSIKVPFNAQLCGNRNPFFELNSEDWACQERLKPCVLDADKNIWRASSFNRVCEPVCPEGYEYQNGSCQIICGEGSFDSDRICLPFKLEVDES